MKQRLYKMAPGNAKGPVKGAAAAELLSSGRLNFAVAPTFQSSSSVTAQSSNLLLDTVRIGVNHTFN